MTKEILENKEIEEILEYMLGKNATGIYCDTAEIEGDGYEEFYSEVSENGFRHLIEDVEGISVASGVTRLVLIPHNKDYVIKLPIMATYEWFSEMWRLDKKLDTILVEYVAEGSWEEDEMLSGTYWDDSDEPWEKIGTHFMKTYYKPDDVDLMDEENAYLDYSPELNKMLLPNVFQGYWHGIPVYTQKQVKNLDGGSLWGGCSTAKLTKLCDNYRAVTSARIPSYKFFESIYNTYGADFTRKFMFDIRETGIDEDLHGNNVGYLEDGTPVIFDYAGYEKTIYTSLHN